MSAQLTQPARHLLWYASKANGPPGDVVACVHLMPSNGMACAAAASAADGVAACRPVQRVPGHPHRLPARAGQQAGAQPVRLCGPTVCRVAPASCHSMLALCVPRREHMCVTDCFLCSTPSASVPVCRLFHNLSCDPQVQLDEDDDSDNDSDIGEMGEGGGGGAPPQQQQQEQQETKKVRRQGMRVGRLIGAPLGEGRANVVDIGTACRTGMRREHVHVAAKHPCQWLQAMMVLLKQRRDTLTVPFRQLLNDPFNASSSASAASSFLTAGMGHAHGANGCLRPSQRSTSIGVYSGAQRVYSVRQSTHLWMSSARVGTHL